MKGSETTTSNFADYCKQIQMDLEKYFSNFPNKNFAIRVLAKESGISDKTIKRLLKLENKPTYDTIFALYSVMLEIEDENQILDLVAPSIKTYLSKMTARKLKVKKKCNFIEVLKKDPIICELFVKAATGGLIENAVVYRYGQYGMELLEKMTELNILREVERGNYKLSPMAPSLEGEVLKFVGLRLTETYGNPASAQETNQNVMSFYASTLNEEGYKEWIKIDTEAFYKKLEVAQKEEFKGAKRYFTFNSTDSMR
jgi:transcriptional regulator with XRE-family HTH domain